MSGPVYSMKASIRKAVEIALNRICKYLSSHNIPFVIMVGWSAEEEVCEVGSYIGPRKDGRFGVWFPGNMVATVIAARYSKFAEFQAQQIQDWVVQHGGMVEALRSIGIDVDGDELSFVDEPKDKEDSDEPIDSSLLGPFEEYFSKKNDE